LVMLTPVVFILPFLKFFLLHGNIDSVITRIDIQCTTGSNRWIAICGYGPDGNKLINQVTAYFNFIVGERSLTIVPALETLFRRKDSLSFFLAYHQPYLFQD
jgi:hypothetical protein